MSFTVESARDLAALVEEMRLNGIVAPGVAGGEVFQIRIATDATWRTSVDSRTWSPAVEHSRFGRLPGIWDATPDSSSPETVRFRTAFVVPGAVVAASAMGGADDDLLNLAINGARIFGESSGWSDRTLINPAIDPDIFDNGTNWVTATARNMGGHSTFAAAITVSFIPDPVIAGFIGSLVAGRGAILHLINGFDYWSENFGPQMVLGYSGDDTIYTGRGDDAILGGVGDDDLFGGHERDILAGGEGLDVLDGGKGADLLFGGDGDDALQGGLGPDRMYGGAGLDVLEGGDGVDRLEGGADDDTINAGDGDDLVIGGTGNDAIRLGAGDDRATVSPSWQRKDFGRGDDGIWGEAGDDRLHGGRGDDTLDGGDGDDYLNGGAGADRLIGGAGADVFQFRGAYGLDVIADFELGDRIAVWQWSDGLGLNGSGS